ncbi:MAG: hypothetical protein HC913_16850 [Microscillaceae bacterium]|nr:hypothetical protein [Microscillaceae bacterium]
MKKIFLYIVAFLLSVSPGLLAQSRTNDIPVEQLPAGVKQVLEQYINILRSSQNLDECAARFVEVAGGSLVNEDGQTLRSSVKPYSLKKDFESIKFYAQPLKISRVNANPIASSSGFGPSAIRGKVYKIWLDKAAGQAGIAAPISIMIPEGHESIKTPKVVSIGSL